MGGYSRLRERGAPTLRLNRPRYHSLVVERGWLTQGEQAAGLGLGQATISRMVEADQAPSPGAIARLLLAFPEETFESLFVIVSDSGMRRAS